MKTEIRCFCSRRSGMWSAVALAALLATLLTGSLAFAGAPSSGSGPVVSAVPVITAVSPASIQPGDKVTIKGQNFGESRGEGPGVSGGAALFVSFSGVKATEYESWSDTEIVCVVPAGAGGTVTVTGRSGTSNSESIAVAFPTWYLAEGSTAWGFNTEISIENPNATHLDARLAFMLPTGEVIRDMIKLPPTSQTRLSNDFLVSKIGEKDFSTTVECVDATKSICVDRTMMWYSGYGNGNAWHSSVGVSSPATKWFLPEGSSNWGFETWLLIQNPNEVPVDCDVTYMIENEGPVTMEKTIPANSRRTFNMAEDIGKKDASIMVEADMGVIPERAMYRLSTSSLAQPGSRREGHDSIGTTQPAQDYFLAEGTSAWGFTTYVLVQNPNDVPANVYLIYMTGEGARPQEPIVMPPNSRKTVRVNDAPGMQDVDFSTQVHSDREIIAERAMYWLTPRSSVLDSAMTGSIGMSSAHATFLLPDGRSYVTDEGPYNIETFTLVQNPNDVPVPVRISYLHEYGGPPTSWTETVPANSRMTFNMRDKLQGNATASIMVESLAEGKNIMVERAMYFQNRWGGTSTIGGYSE